MAQFRAAGALSTGGALTSITPLTPGMPPGVVLGDLLRMHVGNKYPGTPSAPATPTTPGGAIWTAPANNQASGGAGASGVDAGDVYATIFVKEADAVDVALSAVLGTVPVRVDGANVAEARIVAFKRDTPTSTWSAACAIGSDTSSGTGFSATAGSNPGISVGDILDICQALNTDRGSSAEAVTATGCTFLALSEKYDDTTATGDDMAICNAQFAVSGGPSSAAPVYTATLGGNGAGAVVFVRIRELGGADGANSWKVPACGADFEAVGQAALQRVWSCGDASGNLVEAWPALSSAPLAATSGVYAQAVSGWTRLGVAGASGSTRYIRGTGSVPFNVTTGSGAFVGYFRFPSAPAGTRTFMMLAGGEGTLSPAVSVYLRMESSGKLTIETGNNLGVVSTVTGVYNYVDGADHAICFWYDRTLGVLACQTDKERIVGSASGSAAWVDNSKGYGAVATTFAFQMLWAGGEGGATAERDWRTFLQNMGVTVSQALSGSAAGVAGGSGVVGAGLTGTAAGVASGSATVLDPTVYFADYVGVVDLGAGYPYRGELVGPTYLGSLAPAAEYIGALLEDSYRGDVDPEGDDMFEMKVADRSPSFQATLKNAETGVAVDLTTATGVTVRFRIGDGAIKTGTAVVVTAASGIVRYDWGASDIDAEGTLQIEFIATFPTGKLQTFPSGGYYEFPVRPNLAT